MIRFLKYGEMRPYIAASLCKRLLVDTLSNAATCRQGGSACIWSCCKQYATYLFVLNSLPSVLMGFSIKIF